MFRVVGFAFIVSLVAQVSAAQELDARLDNFDITGLVRFDSPDEAEARRGEMIKLIWPDGITTARPKVTESIDYPPELRTVDKTLVSRVDRYDVDVMNADFHSIVYVLYPKEMPEGPARLAVVQAGHMLDGYDQGLSAGLDKAVDTLLKRGFVVATVQMPVTNWNTDTDGTLASGTKVNVTGRRTGGHDEMFEEVEPELKGQTLRFFLDPVVETINELVARHPSPEMVLMIGLSGGGWTTHLAAAADTRIDVSLPLAGALPLYARPFSPGSKGDAEQEYAPLYREVDSNGDGVLDRADGACSWLEIFGLGGVSPDADRPRVAVMVLNLYDTCCFGGPVFKTFDKPLDERIEAVGRGRWHFHSDDSHKSHIISPEVLEEVMPAAIEEWQQLQPERTN
jgi:hypothetical protein